MKFDIIMIVTLFVAMIFFLGGVTGVAAYNKNPYLVVSKYADERVQNFSNTTTKCIVSDRTTSVFCEFRRTLSFMMYQSFAAGIEFGFAHPWIGELAFSIATLVLVLIYFLSDNLSIILIPIALAIIAKDWISEHYGNSKGTQHDSKTD